MGTTKDEIIAQINKALSNIESSTIKTRELSLVKTKLEEALLWLSKVEEV